MTTTGRLLYTGRTQGVGRKGLVYVYLDADQARDEARTYVYAKPLLQARPGTIISVTFTDEDRGSVRMNGEAAPRVDGHLPADDAAALDAADRANYIDWQRHRADVAAAREARDLDTYLAPIARQYRRLPSSARTAFLADIMSRIVQAEGRL